VSKEQIRSLHFLHDRFARNVATSLSAYLRAVTDVNDRVGRAVHLLRVPDVAARPDGVLRRVDGAARRLAALELNPNVAFTMIDRMLGGTGRGVASPAR
jgi:flagellar motor switch protein FliM